jgi:adenosylhomocysteine nucleosidase
MEQSYTNALIMATLSEAKPFINGLGLKEETGHPFPVFSNPDLVMVICGIGKANAAMGTTYCNITFDPVQILNLGAAGAVDGAAKLGDVYQVSKIFEPDRPTFKTMGPAIHTPDTLGNFSTATLATHDRPIIDPGDRMNISRIAGLVDMEAASVVQACRKFNKKCIVFKFVSDTPDHTEGSDIVGNIKKLRFGFFNFFHRNILPELEN